MGQNDQFVTSWWRHTDPWCHFDKLLCQKVQVFGAKGAQVGDLWWKRAKMIIWRHYLPMMSFSEFENGVIGKFPMGMAIIFLSKKCKQWRQKCSSWRFVVKKSQNAHFDAIYPVDVTFRIWKWFHCVPWWISYGMGYQICVKYEFNWGQNC